MTVQIKSVAGTVLQAHIDAVLEVETDLIVRGKAQAAHFRGVRLQLEAVFNDIERHPIYQDEAKLFEYVDENMARVLCHQEGMDPDFEGPHGPNWKLFTQEQRKATWKLAGRMELEAELRMNK